MVLKALLVVAVLVVVVGYMCYERLPDEIAEPGMQRIMRLSWVAMSFKAKALALLGYGNQWTNMRSSMNAALSALLPKAIPDENLKVFDTVFDGIKVRVYQPKSAKSLPGLVYYHGGGWYFGDIETHDPLTRKIAKEGNIVVVSVEYRLAPENKYPIPLDDCMKATKYFLNKAADYGINPSRVSIGGDSAGGNLAAAVSLRLRDENVTPQIKTQILIYPVTQFCNQQLPIFQSGFWDLFGLVPNIVAAYILTEDEQFEAFNSDKHLTSEAIAACKKFVDYQLIPKKYIPDGYKPKTYGTPSTSPAAQNISKHFLNPYVFPLMAKSLKKLPPTYLFTSGLDTLRDEGILYAKRLEADGVDVEWVHFAETQHGVFNLENNSLSFPKVFANLMDYIKRRS